SALPSALGRSRCARVAGPRLSGAAAQPVPGRSSAITSSTFDDEIHHPPEGRYQEVRPRPDDPYPGPPEDRREAAVVKIASRLVAAPDDRTAQRVNVAGAHQQAQIVGTQRRVQEPAGIVELRQPCIRAPTGGVGGGSGDQMTVDAGKVLGPLARGV